MADMPATASSEASPTWIRNTVAGFWKLCSAPGALPFRANEGAATLRRFEPDDYLFGAGGAAGSGMADGQLPFNPDEVFENYLFERYARHDASLRGAYYRLRPFIPIWLRRTLQRWQARRCDTTRFPRWPLELSLVRFHQLLLGRLLRDTPELSYVSFWPRDRSFAFVLTHDVDSADGFNRIESVARIEHELGFRSAWFVVPELYPVDWNRLARLAEEGFEVGIHGLRHDGRLLASREIFASRVPQINDYVRRCGAAGFRSPATLRRADWLQEIAVEYDASYFDTDPFEPQPGGTCSWFPFFLGRLVELPYTLPQDFTLFEKLRVDGAAVWTDKLGVIERYRGMALMLTHPDYLDRPDRLDAYRRTLQWVAKRANCWHALPRDVSRWWRARHDAQWRADGRLEGAGPWGGELRCGAIGQAADGEPRW
jgi:hypothetical protein